MSSSSLHTLRSGALTLLASVLATGVGAAQVEAEVARLLAVELEAVEQTAELAESLVGLGTGAIGPVFEALAAGAVTGAEGERIELGPLHGEAGLAAFASFSPTAVRSFLGSLDRAALDASGRRTALAVYGRMGTQDDLRHIASIAAPLVRSELIALPTRDAFRSAIEQILSRDVAALGRVGDAFEVAHPTLKGELIGALRSVRARGTIGTLNRLLGREPELDLLILTALRDLIRTSVEPFDAGLADHVRTYLDHDEWRFVHGAVLVAGELEDPRAVERLIGLLDCEDPNLAASANGALERIARRNFRAEPERWSSWYMAERAWWDEAQPRILEDLRSGMAARIARSLNEVAEHRLFLRELELTLIEQLAGQDEGLVVMTCGALAQLGARGALAELTELAAHSQPPVSEAAAQAVFRISGIRLQSPAPAP